MLSGKPISKSIRDAINNKPLGLEKGYIKSPNNVQLLSIGSDTRPSDIEKFLAEEKSRCWDIWPKKPSKYKLEYQVESEASHQILKGMMEDHNAVLKLKKA